MQTLEKNLNEILDLPEIIYPAKIKTIDTSEPTVDADFETSRTNIRDIIAKGSLALDGILDLATVSEHPRTYEVAAQMISTLIDANRDLLNLHKQLHQLKPETAQPANVTNAIFVGSTMDLQRLLKESRKNENIIPMEQN